MENKAAVIPTPEDVKKKIREFIVSNFLFGKDSPGLKDESSFLQSGVIDSTGILELIRFIEVTYMIKVADKETIPENLDSLNNVARFVITKSGEAR